MIQIGADTISEDSPMYIIAEVGVNHNGSLSLAKKLVDVAVQSKANAVKFQFFHPDDLASEEAELVAYQRHGTKKRKQKEMLQELALTPNECQDLKQYCEQSGLAFLATPFDIHSARLLHKMNVPAFKIGSGDLTFWPLLEELKTYGKPLILSTGMATLREIELTLDFIGEDHHIILLHCTSNYPARHEQLNLRAIQTLKSAFQKIIGYSDHSLGIETPIAAVTLGYKVLEKHLTLDQSMEGPDHASSLAPEAFQSMVQKIRNIEAALGSTMKRMQQTEDAVKQGVRRGVYVKRDAYTGQILKEDDLMYLRPLAEIEAHHYQKIIGKRLRKDKKKGSTLSWDDIE